MHDALRLVLLGPPGSGKGTQGKMLERAFGTPHLAAGDILRHEVAAATPLGCQVKAVMERGALVEDQLIIDMMTGCLGSRGERQNWVLDGFPRTVVQAEALDRWLATRGLTLTAAVDFEIDEEEVVRRLSGRWVCPACSEGFQMTSRPPQVSGRCDVCGEALEQRTDDRAETVRERIRVYRQATETLVGHYDRKGLLWRMPAKGSIDAIFSQLCALIEGRAT